MKKILKNKKGFTLVEIIVVLVILAILAGAAIPTMLGFIDDAKGKANIAEARAAYVAAQTIASEEFAADGTVVIDDTDKAKIKTLAGAEGDVTDVTMSTTEDGKVDSVTYISEDGKKQVVITAGKAAKISDTDAEEETE